MNTSVAKSVEKRSVARSLQAVAAVLAVAFALGGCDSEADDSCAEGPGVACVFMGSEIAGLGPDDLPPRETDLYLPQDVSVAPDGTVYVVDWNNHRIRTVHDGSVQTVLGTGYLGDAPAGPADAVPLNHPTHLSFALDGRVIVSAWHNSKVLAFDPARNWVEPICGTGARSYEGDGGPAVDAVLDLPVSTAIGSDGSIYIADQANQRVRKIDPTDTINTVVGTGVPGFSGDDGPALEAQISLPGGQAAPPAGRIAVDRADNLYIADSSNHRVRKVDPQGVITTVAGDGTPTARGDGGPATAASLSRPSDVDVDAEGNLYIADTDNSCIRKVGLDGTISTVAGICGSPGKGQEGGIATKVALDRPYGIAFDSGDGALYIADTHNHRIVVVYPE
jgi:DNA-binding beta-propeller fold protein YncE